jgi:geranylgeranyl diphosphate synthase type I
MTVTLPEALHRGRALAGPALRAAIDRLEPDLWLVSAYHLGWVDADGRPEPASGGKAVRPALALLSAEAAGASAEVGLPGAVAVELVHNFSLLHDDVMDGDTERRHRLTAWAAFSESRALLAGDAMLALAQQVLLEAGTPEACRAAASLADTTQRLIAGQAADLAFEARDDVALPECVEMAGGKTGALLSCAASIGATLAGAPAYLVDGLAAYGAHLGLAFQLVDDLLGIWGDPTVTGKPVRSDLRSRKKSLPVVHAMNAGGTEARALRRWLQDPAPHGEAELCRAAELVEAAGGRAWAAAEADRRLAAARGCVADLDLPAAVRDELLAVARFVTRREH